MGLKMIFRYTILYVRDVAKTVNFYSRAFAVEDTFLHPSGDYGELRTGVTKLAFSSTSLMERLGKTPGLPKRGSPTFEIAFETDDVAGGLERAIDAGATLVQEVKLEAWGQETAYVHDLNGYLVEICSAVQLPKPG